MTTIGRQPLELVEVELDRCALSYSTGACTAPAANGTSAPLGSQCYNTFKTCLDKPNYSLGTSTFTFSKNQNTGITDRVVFPALISANIDSTEVAFGRSTKNLGSLGKRDVTRVRLQDFTFGDTSGIDPYQSERVHDTNNGTFFGKLRARNPYYYGRRLRVLSGFVGDARSDMVIRHYLITEWKGPDSRGNVTIVGKDPLILADAQLSQYPRPTTGELQDSLAPTDTTFTVEPVGIGIVYATAGRVIVGDEIMRFTRVGEVFTLTHRGVDGSEVGSHSPGDTVQECFHVNDAEVADVLFTLLREGARIPVSQLPVEDWRTELRTYLQTVRATRTVPKPRSVAQLVGELARLGLLIWWDHSTQTIKVRVIRPQFGVVARTLTDENDIIEGTVRREDVSDQRVSQVWIYSGVLNSVRSTDNPDNYARLHVEADLGSEGDNEYDQQQVLEVFQPWLGTDSGSVYIPISADRLLKRYRDTPFDIALSVDASAGYIGPGDILRVHTGLTQNARGDSVPTTVQVRSVQTDGARSRTEIKAQSFELASGRFGRIAPDNYPASYNNATQAQKDHGTWLVGSGTDFTDGTGPYVLF